MEYFNRFGGHFHNQRVPAISPVLVTRHSVHAYTSEICPEEG